MDLFRMLLVSQLELPSFGALSDARSVGQPGSFMVDRSTLREEEFLGMGDAIARVGVEISAVPRAARCVPASWCPACLVDGDGP